MVLKDFKFTGFKVPFIKQAGEKTEIADFINVKSRDRGAFFKYIIQ